MAYRPIYEQEVIITYNRAKDAWYYYGDVPPLNRKWKDVIEHNK